MKEIIFLSFVIVGSMLFLIFMQTSYRSNWTFFCNAESAFAVVSISATYITISV